jgi:cell wall assembly regulator SMI1
MDKNNFLNLSPQLTAEDISRVESAIGCRLPDDLKQHYLRFNGGRPERSLCRTADDDYISVHGFMPMCYGENGELFETVWRWHKIDTPFIPAHLIPFAYDVGGEYFCYSVAPNEAGTIYHFLSEFTDSPNRALIYISSSLEAFINSLEDENNG